jgi:hypothetical protein
MIAFSGRRLLFSISIICRERHSACFSRGFDDMIFSGQGVSKRCKLGNNKTNNNRKEEREKRKEANTYYLCITLRARAAVSGPKP